MEQTFTDLHYRIWLTSLAQDSVRSPKLSPSLSDPILHHYGNSSRLIQRLSLCSLSLARSHTLAHSAATAGVAKEKWPAEGPAEAAAAVEVGGSGGGSGGIGRKRKRRLLDLAEAAVGGAQAGLQVKHSSREKIARQGLLAEGREGGSREDDDGTELAWPEPEFALCMARIPSYIQPYMLDHVGKARGKTRDWSGGERADHWESSGHGDDRDRPGQRGEAGAELAQ